MAALALKPKKKDEQCPYLAKSTANSIMKFMQHILIVALKRAYR
jgi:hypothetical protein